MLQFYSDPLFPDPPYDMSKQYHTQNEEWYIHAGFATMVYHLKGAFMAYNSIMP